MEQPNEQQINVDQKPTSEAFEKAMTKVLSYGDLCINAEFGMRVLNKYMHELEMVKSGVPFAALSFNDEKKRTKASVLTFDQPDAIEGDFEEGDNIISNRDIKPGSIAVIKLEGVMNSQDDMCAYGIGYQVNQLRMAYGNPQISAIILEVNSGGGEVTAMNMMVQALGERNKPVIGYGHFVASAAYGSIAATDEVIAAGEIASFGSIGAMMAIDMRMVDFMRRYVKFFYGENAPKKNAGLRGMLEDDFSTIQNDVNEYTDSFHAMVRGARELKGSDTYQKETLSGQMFMAAEAKRRGLIDGVGNMNYAIKRARTRAQNYKR